MTHQLINGFLNDLQEKGYSSNTIRAYKSVLARSAVQYHRTNCQRFNDYYGPIGVMLPLHPGSPPSKLLQMAAEKGLLTMTLLKYRSGPDDPASDSVSLKKTCGLYFLKLKSPIRSESFFELLRDTDMQIEDLLKLNVEDIKFRLNTAFIKTDEGFVTVKTVICWSFAVGRKWPAFCIQQGE